MWNDDTDVTAGWRWPGLHTMVDVWHWPVLKHRQPCEALAGWSTFRSKTRKKSAKSGDEESRVVELKKLTEELTMEEVTAKLLRWAYQSGMTAHGFIDMSADHDCSGLAAMFTEDRCQKLRDGGMMLVGIWQVSVLNPISYRFHFPISHPSCPQHRNTFEEYWNII